MYNYRTEYLLCNTPINIYKFNNANMVSNYILSSIRITGYHIHLLHTIIQQKDE